MTTVRVVSSPLGDVTKGHTYTSPGPIAKVLVWADKRQPSLSLAPLAPPHFLQCPPFWLLLINQSGLWRFEEHNEEHSGLMMSLPPACPSRPPAHLPFAVFWQQATQRFLPADLSSWLLHLSEVNQSQRDAFTRPPTTTAAAAKKSGTPLL